MRSNKELDSLNSVKDILALTGITATETVNQFAHYDLDCSNDGIIEVKERWIDKSKFTQYSKEGFILEDIKYKYLFGKKSLYCNLFDYSENKIALFWNVNKINSNITNMNCKATTTFSNTSYTSKQIHLVNIDQCAYIFVYENDMWSKTDKQTVINKIIN